MLKTLIALPMESKCIALRCWFSFVYWHMVIAYLPYRFWKQSISAKAKNITDISITEIRNLIRITESVGRHHFVKVNCLRRCMVQKSVLQRRGIDCTLVFGVKKTQNTFAAHCWLTHQNQIINDSQDTTSEYVALEKADTNNANILKNLN
jgi:hypothetical protein